MGYLAKSDPDPWRSRGQRALEEFDTFACAHHGGIVKLVLNKDVRPERARFEVRKSAVTWCKNCMGMICDPCAAFRCDPIEAKLGRYEQSGDIGALIGSPA